MAEGKVIDGWYQTDNDINSVIDGVAGNGVISGLTGAEDSPADMSVVIAAGSYVANGTEVTKGSEIDVTIEAADGSNPRKDIIIADSAGNITVVKGTAATAVPSGQTGPNTSTPVPGNITANKIILAEVWVGAGVTTILDANITDRRIITRSSKVVWKDTQTEALADLNRTATVAYADLDLTASTSANAKFAILNLRIIIDSVDANGYIFFKVRKNGTTSSDCKLFVGDYSGDKAGAEIWTQVIVGMDSGQVIEWEVTVGGTIQTDNYILVVGYIE